MADAVGQPPSMKIGSPAAAWIWQDPTGGKWHLRTTTRRDTHEFAGRISSDGSISAVLANGLEHNDVAHMDGKDLVYDLSTQGVMDGFDFTLTADKCVTFQVLIDTKVNLAQIFLGAKEEHPKATPFKLCR